MTETRREQLLAWAAECFDKLASPFDGSWLSEHQVTLNECADLSEDVARAIRLYLKVPKAERTARALQDAMEEVGFPSDIAKNAADSLRARTLTHQLKTLQLGKKTWAARSVIDRGRESL